jgi:hypothetical protein
MEAPIKKTKQSGWYCMEINPVLPIARQDSRDTLRDIWNFL